MVELQTRQEVVLLVGGKEGDAIGPCHRTAGQMARPQADHPLFASAWQQLDVHQPRCAGHGGLAAELCGGGWSETEALAPGHGERECNLTTLTAWIRGAADGAPPPQDPAGAPALAGAVGGTAEAPPAGVDALGTSPSPLCTAETTPRPFTVCSPPITNPVELPPSRLRASRSPAARST